MICLDTNILVYAFMSEMTWHLPAKKFLEETASSDSAWSVPYHCIAEFLSIVTNKRVFKKPAPLHDALFFLDGVLASPSLSLLTELHDFYNLYKNTALKSKVTGARLHDARIAALCIQNGVKILYSADRDFSFFSGLKVKNPLT